MTRTQTMVQLTDELIRALDAEAARKGTSRSAVIREILSSFLAESTEAHVSSRIVQGYERIPPTTPDGWGQLDRERDVATGELLQRLDAEERSEGQGW